MAGVITASEASWIAPFSGLSPRAFGKLVTVLRRQGADAVRKGRPWSRPLEDRALLVAEYWRTNLTMRQLAPLFGVSKSAADRIIDHLGPMLALQPRKRFAKDTVLIVDGTLVPTWDHTLAERSKNYRYSTNHQTPALRSKAGDAACAASSARSRGAGTQHPRAARMFACPSRSDGQGGLGPGRPPQPRHAGPSGAPRREP
ncbi:transposase family protein, partial [Streptomyces parvulus]|uniref:transposase family protein n=1 Tax=Streptomyces parvulus TaxID=146923 RepID=UPI0033EE351E